MNWKSVDSRKSGFASAGQALARVHRYQRRRNRFDVAVQGIPAEKGKLNLVKNELKPFSSNLVISVGTDFESMFLVPNVCMGVLVAKHISDLFRLTFNSTGDFLFI